MKIKSDFVTNSSAISYVFSRGCTKDFDSCRGCIISVNCSEFCEKGMEFSKKVLEDISGKSNALVKIEMG